jgi:hypothetical protein
MAFVVGWWAGINANLCPLQWGFCRLFLSACYILQNVYVCAKCGTQIFNVVFFIVKGLYSETGFHIDMDRNFVCL